MRWAQWRERDDDNRAEQHGVRAGDREGGCQGGRTRCRGSVLHHADANYRVGGCEEGPVAAVLSNGERVSANDRIDSDHAPDGRGKAVGHALESRRTGENRKFDGEVFDLSELRSRTVGAARDAAKAKEQAADRHGTDDPLGPKKNPVQREPGVTMSTSNDQAEEAVEVLAHLNERARAQYLATLTDGRETKAIQLIKARLRDYGKQTLLRVIDAKADEWGKSEKMRQYLRPKTLFDRLNCEQYVGQLPQHAAEQAAADTLRTTQ